jgi:hypothetical protein
MQNVVLSKNFLPGTIILVRRVTKNHLSLGDDPTGSVPHQRGGLELEVQSLAVSQIPTMRV